MIASTRVSWPSSTLASLGRFCSGPIFGNISTIFFERAHLANLLKLIAKIFKREFFLAQLAFEVGGGFLINRLLDAFDDDMRSPMPRTRETIRSG